MSIPSTAVESAFLLTDAIADFLAATEAQLDAEARTVLRDRDAASRASRLVADALPSVREFLDERYAELSRLDELLTAAEREDVARYHRFRVQPKFLGSRFVRWSIDKPFGYPGDYRIVEMLFDNQPDGPSPFAQVLSTYTLDVGPCRAHRARMPWVHGHLHAAQATAGRPLDVLSFACGPERVMRSWYAAGNEASLTLCDFDARALEHADKELRKVFQARGTTSPVRAVPASAFDLIKQPSSVDALRSSRPEGTYDVVMVLGLLDYLKDAQAAKLLNVLTTVLAPGGLCLLTNLHTGNPWRSFMHYVGHWTVLHRTRDAFGALASGNGRTRQLELVTDASGTNVFYAGERSA